MAKKEVVEEVKVEETKNSDDELKIDFDALAETNTVSSEENVHFADRVEAKKKTIKNPFARAMYTFVMFIVVAFLDFLDSFRRNPIKIGGWLIAIPGVFIGFLMNYELNTVYHLASVEKAPICMFILVLCGMINIFEAFSIIKNKNLGSIIIAGILALIIAASGIVYISDVSKVTKDLGRDLSSDAVTSFIVVGGSIAISFVGIVIAFIFRDKEYKKDKF